MRHLAVLRRRVRRAVLGRRRVLAALCAALAMLALVRTVAPPPAPAAEVLVAARDLVSGAVLTAADLRSVRMPPDVVPSGALAAPADVVGRTAAAPLRAGQPITDLSVVRGSLLDGYPGSVGAPVRVADAGAVGLLRVGDRVDVLAADPQAPPTTPARVVAAQAPVVALPRSEHDSFGGDSSPAAGSGGALVVLAVPPATAQRLASAAVAAYVSVVLTR